MSNNIMLKSTKVKDTYTANMENTEFQTLKKKLIVRQLTIVNALDANITIQVNLDMTYGDIT